MSEDRPEAAARPSNPSGVLGHALAPAIRRVVRTSAERAVGRLAHRIGSSATLRQKMFNALRLDRVSVQPLAAVPELEFLAHAFTHRHRSRAQIMQDLWVSFELDGQQGGFFVEFGATDGLTNSNTALLESRYGWRGILAEPNPAWHGALQQNRAAAVDRRCVAARSGETIDFLVVEDPELSTIAAYAGGDHFAEFRRRAVPISVETVALNDLLSDHGAPSTIDYMSIDTEGSEWEILSTFDFGRWHVRLFSIEHNHTEQQTRIDALLTGHGYERVLPELSQWDSWYRWRGVPG